MKDCIVEVFIAMTELDPNDKLFMDKVAALMKVNSIAQTYSSEGYDAERLVRPITEKKIAFIKDAKTKGALKEILNPQKIRYNGNEVVPTGSFHIPEEELIIWSLTSLRAPLVHAGMERMLKLMNLIYPEFEF